MLSQEVSLAIVLNILRYRDMCSDKAQGRNPQLTTAAVLNQESNTLVLVMLAAMAANRTGLLLDHIWMQILLHDIRIGHDGNVTATWNQNCCVLLDTFMFTSFAVS